MTASKRCRPTRRKPCSAVVAVFRVDVPMAPCHSFGEGLEEHPVIIDDHNIKHDETVVEIFSLRKTVKD
jgi:hypothetical protein